MILRLNNIVSVGVLLAIFLALGRVAGFFREIFLAHTYGANVVADLAIYTLTLPDILVNIFLSGGLTVALIPLISKNIERIGAIFFQISVLVLSLFTLIAICIVLFPSVSLIFLAPGLFLSSVGLSFWQSIFLGLAIILTAFSGVTGAILNAQNKYLIAGAGTLIFNTFIIFFIYVDSVSQSPALTWFCAGVALGALVRVLAQLLSLPAITYKDCKYEWLLSFKFLKAFVYGLASTSILVALPIIIRSGISMFGDGYLSLFNYSLKLVELPNAILISSAITIAYPKLCAAVNQEDLGGIHDLAKKNISNLLVISFVILLVGIFYSDLIVKFLFGNGLIRNDELAYISMFTRVGYLSIPFIAIGGFLMALINALGYSKHVLMYSFYGVILACILVIFSYHLESKKILILTLPITHLFLCISSYLFLKKLGYYFGSYFKSTLKPIIILAAGFYFFWALEVYVLKDIWRLSDNFYVQLIRLSIAFLIFLLLISIGLFLNRQSYNNEKNF